MIKSDELRRNNKVYWKKRVVVVDCIHPNVISEFGAVKESINDTYERKFIKCEELEPIPLTEDILLDNGFEKLDGFPSTFIMEIETYSLSPVIQLFAYLDNTGAASAIRLIQDSNSKGNMLQIKSLHQLQNLYSILTDDEL
ncbi:hypothetical protein [Dysgonomonas mossii]|uniref:hypothetical protein n=1 Tax=Dysgonomonas mossii TaxID=163665 RepID=UPI003993C1B6